MNLIFLSNAHKDKVFVDEVHRQLKSSGISTWCETIGFQKIKEIQTPGELALLMKTNRSSK